MSHVWRHRRCNIVNRNCHRAGMCDRLLSSLTAKVGGERTADVLLKVMEDAVGLAVAEEGAVGDPPTKKQKPDPGQKAADVSNCFTMKAHRAVLWPLSEYFASKFSNWSNSSGMPEVAILVPAGHLEVGKALVAAMYGKLPDDLSQQQLLQLLVLSDSYKIDGVTEAVISRFSSLPVEQLQWDVVLAIQQLPPEERLSSSSSSSSSDDDDDYVVPSQFQSLKVAARRRMTQLLGDLEVVWGLEHPHQRQLLQKQFGSCSASAMASRAEEALQAKYGNKLDAFSPQEMRKLRDAAVAAQTSAVAAAANPTPPHELLLQLPFEQLVGLLRSCEIRVMSENSMHYTITRWLQQQHDITSEQLKKLAELVHLRNCTPNYLISMVCQEGDWLMQQYPGPQLAQTVAACIAERHSTIGMFPWKYQTNIAGRYAVKRPASALDELEISCHIPLAAIKEFYNDEHESDIITYHHPEVFQWQGTHINFTLDMALDPGDFSDEDKPFRAGYVNGMSVGFRNTGTAGFSGKVSVWRSQPQDRQPVAYVTQRFKYKTPLDMLEMYIIVDAAWHGDDTIPSHVEMQYTAANWDELQQKLRDFGLVHEDGCLHVTAVLTHLH